MKLLNNINYLLGQNNFNIDFRKRHSFHLVDASPWPFLASVGALCLTLNSVIYFHSYGSFNFVLYSFFYVALISAFWWRDVIREATFEGCHTKVVQKGLKLGMLLFIVTSENLNINQKWIMLSICIFCLRQSTLEERKERGETHDFFLFR